MRKGSQVSLLMVAVAVATVASTRAQESSTIQDVSPPIVNFECGRRSPTLITYPPGPEPKIMFGPLLRPGHNRSAPPPTLPASVAEGMTVEMNAWPWMALLGERVAGKISWYCGGSLINEQWILTALHCFLSRTFNVVRLGEHDYENDRDGAIHVDMGIAETILYPGYVHSQGYNDLALLKLDTKLTIQKGIRPVCLPWGKDSNVDLTGKKVTLTGWGDTAYKNRSTTALQKADLTVFPSSQCDEAFSNLLIYPLIWPNGIGNETICAGDPFGNRDACQGDSGGPIVSLNPDRKYTLAGVVSKGYGCGNKEYPGLYVNLRRQEYLAWIKKVAF